MTSTSHEDRAAEMVGNWQRFDSFGWADAPDPKQWTLVNLYHRDSGPLDISNGETIVALVSEPYPAEDVGTEEGPDHFRGRSRHWGYGHVETLAIRVYDDAGNLTPAFVAYAEAADRMEDYPVLDEDDYCRREMVDAEDTLEHSYGIPADRVGDVFSYLFDAYSACSGEEYRQDMIDDAREALGIHEEE